MPEKEESQQLWQPGGYLIQKRRILKAGRIDATPYLDWEFAGHEHGL